MIGPTTHDDPRALLELHGDEDEHHERGHRGRETVDEDAAAPVTVARCDGAAPPCPRPAIVKPVKTPMA